MRILYGVVGEGMGHATRSRVVIEHVLARGHEVLVAVSGRAHGFLARAFAGRERLSLVEIHGLTMDYEGNALDLSETIRTNLAAVPKGLRDNFQAYRDAVRPFHADAVFTDFDSFAYVVGRLHRLPVVSIDNIQMLNRCEHDDEMTDGRSASYRLAKAATKARLPGAYHYLITTFFHPPVRKPRTTLVPPILRPEILAARREPGDHVLVYQTATSNTELVPTLRRLPQTFRVYGLRRDQEREARPEAPSAPDKHRTEAAARRGHRAQAGRLPPLTGSTTPRSRLHLRETTSDPPEHGRHPTGLPAAPLGNVTLRDFSQEGFVEDLRTARAVIAGGGYSLMGEAVHLRVPMLSIPLEGQYEQQLNARYLARLGYGAFAETLTADQVTEFLGTLPRYAQALASYRPRDNGILYACVDELLAAIERGGEPPETLRAGAELHASPPAGEERT